MSGSNKPFIRNADKSFYQISLSLSHSLRVMVSRPHLDSTSNKMLQAFPSNSGSDQQLELFISTDPPAEQRFDSALVLPIHDIDKMNVLLRAGRHSKTLHILNSSITLLKFIIVILLYSL